MALLAPAAQAAEQPTKYSLAGGCWSLASASGGGPIAGASQLRLKATRLGSYMLYGLAGDYLAAAQDTVIHDSEPGPAADWQVRDAPGGTFTLSPASQPGKALSNDGGVLGLSPRVGADAVPRFHFAAARGCATYPEAELNVSGKPATGATPYGEVTGVLDGHMHWMNFEYLGGNFHCGSPWSRYGITVALPDCSSIEGPQGIGAPIQNFLNFGLPESPHDTSGYPEMTSWANHNLTYEGTYYRWIQRDWKAGLRMIVMPVNENRVLCELMPSRRNSCNEMDATRKELDDMYALQDYVDAQAGGPGKGFFQIVKNPFEARRVINNGQMAVVLEVEISEPFDCRGYHRSDCDRSDVDAGLDYLYRRGVRSSLLLNKFDNSLTGVRFDGGPIGLLINAANYESSGSFWSAKTCNGPEHDNEVFTGVPPASSFLAGLIAQLGVSTGQLPAYPPAPHCNTRGLTSLGRYTVNRMMDRGMIVNPDHESQAGVDDTISIAERRNYSGIISPHGWMDPLNWPRIWQLGGMAFPGAGSAEGFVDAWRQYRPRATPHLFGWAYGADLGGLATQGAPPASPAENHVHYPFRSIDGTTTVHPQVTGDRSFEYGSDGVAHYGLYADWYRQVSKLGGPQMTDDMLRGPEAYLEMWERSVGIEDSGCKSAKTRFTPRGLGDIKLGMTPRRLLESAGQPLARTRAWSYCVEGGGGHPASNTAVLTPGGRVSLVASTAAGNEARGIGVGASTRALRDRGARSLGGGIWAAGNGGRTVVWVVRGGKVRTVGVAKSTLLRQKPALRSYLRLVPRHGVSPRPPSVATAAASSVSPTSAIPASAVRGAPQFPMFCGL